MTSDRELHTFVFELAGEHVPAVGGAALRLYGPFGHAITHAEPRPGEWAHAAVLVAPVRAGADLADMAEELRVELVEASGTPSTAVGLYAIVAGAPRGARAGARADEALAGIRRTRPGRSSRSAIPLRHVTSELCAALPFLDRYERSGGAIRMLPLPAPGGGLRGSRTADEPPGP